MPMVPYHNLQGRCEIKEHLGRELPAPLGVVLQARPAMAIGRVGRGATGGRGGQTKQGPSYAGGGICHAGEDIQSKGLAIEDSTLAQLCDGGISH